MDTQASVLKDRLDKNIDSFYNKRISNRRWALFFRLTIVSLGALTTILIGLSNIAFEDDPDPRRFLVPALIVSAIIPIVAAWDAFYDSRWLWIRYTETLTALYGIRDQFLFAQAADNVSEEEKEKKIADLFAELQKTLAESNQQYTKNRLEDKKPASTPETKS
jgi:hypothetical protein